MTRHNHILQNLFILISLLLLGIAVILIVYNFSSIFFPKMIPPQAANILVLGLDGSGNATRTDVLMLINIKPDEPRVSVISIPRDFRIYIPGYGLGKINSAYALGGVRLLKKAVSDFLGIPITHFIRLDFIGLTNIVDRLGGVIIDVEKRMVYADKSQNLNIDLYPGLQRLNGIQAIGYIRFRHDNLGDIGRMERQQKFISSLVEEISKITNLTRIPELILELGHNVETNIGPLKMVSLSLAAKKAYDNDKVQYSQLKGTSVTINGVAYLEPDLPDLNQKIQDFLL
jgi:LCP family protein required for cell wall assembly